MMRLLCLLMLATLSLPAQSLLDAVPSPDAEYRNSKQARRMADRSGNRNAAGHPNMDWARWQAWLKLDHATNRSSQPEPWVNLGPDTASGRIIGLAFHPTDPDEFLVGSASGGLWRTRNYGDSWECLTDNYPTMGVGAVAYNPQNPSSILIATGEGYGFGGEFTSGFGILISHDDGASWQTTNLVADLSNSFAGMDLVWHPTDTNIVNAATSYGVYRSTDGGQTWSGTLAKLPARMKADPQDPDRLYLTARYYTADFPGGFFVSDDAGFTWTQIAGTGLPPDDEFGYASLHIHAVHTDQIYLVVGQSAVFGSGPMRGLFKSSDRGATFVEIPTGVDLMCYHPPYQNICQSWFGNTIAVSPTDTNALFCGGTRFRRSQDGGSTWVTADLNPGATYYSLHPDHHQTQFHPITGDLVDCHDGGVGISADGGLTWFNKSNGLITHQFYDIAVGETDPGTVIGGTQDVGAFTVRDVLAGNWKNPVGGDAFGCAVDPTDADVWYISDLNYGRQKSVDAGENWSLINAGMTWDNQWRLPIALHPGNPNTMFTAEYASIYRSSNGGGFWTSVAGLGPIQAFAFDAVDPDLMYASQLWGNGIYRSTDGGFAWVPVTSPPGFPVTELAAHPTQEAVLFATVGSFGVGEQLYRSEDAGNSWFPIGAGLPAVPMHALAIDVLQPDHMYIGGDLGVWVSTDGGNSFTSFNDGLPVVVVEDLHHTTGDTALHIGTYGRGYWKTRALDPPPVSGLVDAVASPAFELWPNPANGRVNITTDAEDALVRVFDPSGALVQETSIRRGMSTFSTQGWTTGLYVIQVTSAQRAASQLLLVVD